MRAEGRGAYQPSACSEVLQSSSTSFQGGILLALIHQGQVGADGIRVVEPAGSFGFKILLRKGNTILVILQRDEKLEAQILLLAFSPCLWLNITFASPLRHILPPLYHSCCWSILWEFCPYKHSGPCGWAGCICWELQRPGGRRGCAGCRCNSPQTEITTRIKMQASR